MKGMDTSSPEPTAKRSEKREVSPLLKIILEMGPLIVFFFANSRAVQLQEAFPSLLALGDPIFVATAMFMVALGISLALSYALTRTLPLLPVVTFVFVVLMGGLTIWLQNDTFIKLKPTITNTLFGSAILIGLAFGRNFLRLVLDTAFNMDDEGWNKLALRWGLFFFVLAAINEIVWRGFSTEFWVAFKVWGVMPITILFTATQIPLIQRHSLDEDDGDTEDTAGA
ncbi:MAG: septation protein A [Pseudomonadota bacterium]